LSSGGYGLNIKRNFTITLSLLVFGLILIIIAPVFAHAETQYVSDNLIIMMRSGAGGDYKIIKTLKTGTPLQVLEDAGEYYRVKTKDGKEGWVLKRYITTDVPKPIIIAGLKRKIAKLKDSIEKLKGERAALKEDINSEKGLHKGEVKKLKRSLSEQNGRIYKLNRELHKTTKEYKKLLEDSANVIKVVSERDRLKKSNAGLIAGNTSLKKENKRLFWKRNIIYFLAGGFVFFIGWIVGQVSRRRRSRF